MCEIPVEPNYFLAQYLLAGYRIEDAVPAYLLRENLAVVRERLDRIEPCHVTRSGETLAAVRCMHSP